MSFRDDELDRLLDRTLDEIRGEQPDARVTDEATRRVWDELAPAIEAESADRRAIRNCEDFQQLIPELIAGKLPHPREMLVRDHFSECLSCRRAFKQARQPVRVAKEAAAGRRGGWAYRAGWRVAAAAVLVLAVWGFSFNSKVLSIESGGIIRIDTIEGELFHISDEGSKPIVEGASLKLDRGDAIRTAKGSQAVLRLDDDSQVELRERSEMTVKKRRYLFPGREADGVIDLQRGSIIVEASDQGSGNLFVDTDDCEVAVTGTVFSVNHGMKGSRVSVVEGEVEVQFAGNKDVLTAGDQSVTRASLEQTPVEHEIAWSRNRARYLELMREVQALGRELDQVFRPGSRYTSEMLELAPADTALYVGLPNVSGQLSDAFDILETRLASNELLREFIEDQTIDTDELSSMLDKIHAYGDHLGEEVVVLLPADADGRTDDAPLILARLSGADAFADLLRSDLEALDDDAAGKMHVIRGELPATAIPASAELIFWIGDDLLAISTDVNRLLAVDAVTQGFLGSTLEGSAFHDTLAQRYDEGVEWLVGVDLERLVRGGEQKDRDALDETGFSDVRHLIIERKQQGDRSVQHATVTFDQPRRRMAAWLAEPAPMGALSYVGPDASLAAGFVMKEPGTLVDDMFAFLGQVDEQFEANLATFKKEHGLDIRRDFAEPLGGEFVMALDGPVLPSPSWKLVIEVYDPQRLERTLEALVGEINQAARDAGAQGATLSKENVGGRDYLRIESLGTGLGASLSFDEGYAIVAPSRALVDRAIQFRRSGTDVTQAREFVSLLPSDGRLHFSGVMYHNLGAVIGPVARTFGGGVELGAEEQALVRALASENNAGLALLYGEPDRIDLVAVSESGLLGSTLNSLSGFGGLLSMPQSIRRVAEQEAGR